MPPLAADSDDSGDSLAVGPFVDRATAVDPRFELSDANAETGGSDLFTPGGHVPLQPRHEIGIMDLMTKLTTISVTTEQHEQLKEMANSEGIAMWELVDRFLRRERRRRIGQMLTETNANRTGEERLFEAAVAAAGSRSVRDALR